MVIMVRKSHGVPSKYSFTVVFYKPCEGFYTCGTIVVVGFRQLLSQLPLNVGLIDLWQLFCVLRLPTFGIWQQTALVRQIRLFNLSTAVHPCKPIEKEKNKKVMIRKNWLCHEIITKLPVAGCMLGALPKATRFFVEDKWKDQEVKMKCVSPYASTWVVALIIIRPFSRHSSWRLFVATEL